MQRDLELLRCFRDAKLRKLLETEFLLKLNVVRDHSTLFPNKRLRRILEVVLAADFYSLGEFY